MACPLLQVISIVFERHPGLKYAFSYTDMLFYMVNHEIISSRLA
jgi:hypothetical protein